MATRAIARRKPRAKTRTVYRYRTRPAAKRNNPGPARRRSTVLGKAKVAGLTMTHTGVAVGAATLFGAAHARAVNIPKIDALGAEGTWGAALWGAGVAFDEPYLKYAGTGLLAVELWKRAQVWFAPDAAAKAAAAKAAAEKAAAAAAAAAKTSGFPQLPEDPEGTVYEGTG